MIRERELLEAWHEGETGRHFYRLEAEMAAAFEYRGPQPGHPSNYAAIRIVATPSAELCLESAAVYPFRSRMQGGSCSPLAGLPSTNSSRWQGSIPIDAGWLSARSGGMRS